MSEHNRNRNAYRHDDEWDQQQYNEYRQRQDRQRNQANYGGHNHDWDRQQDNAYANTNSNERRYDRSGTGFGESYDRYNRAKHGQHDFNQQPRYEDRFTNEGYGGGYSNQHNPYGRREQQSGNNWGNNYGEQYRSSNRNQHQHDNTYRGEDRGWWDKTRDEVSSWFGDDDAERRRRMDHLVSGQHRGKGPRDYRRSDDRIMEDACDRLSDDSFVDASNIEVKVNASEVILSGTVESREAKRRAEDIVESISGVANVQNHLRVAR
jgi:osmotically-inducible protein OsmY